MRWSGLLVLLVAAACGNGAGSRDDHIVELCALKHACNGYDEATCLAVERESAASDRDCRALEDAVTACMVREGGSRCETASGLTALVPTERCDPQVARLQACLFPRLPQITR